MICRIKSVVEKASSFKNKDGLQWKVISDAHDHIAAAAIFYREYQLARIPLVQFLRMHYISLEANHLPPIKLHQA